MMISATNTGKYLYPSITTFVWVTTSWENTKFDNIMFLYKRGSRHAAHAAKALRWRIEHVLESLI